MNNLFRVPLLALAFTSSVASAFQYDMTINPLNNSLIDVKVNTEKLGVFQIQPSRTARSEHQPTLTCITSTGKNESIKYQQEVICDSVTWQLSLSKVDETGFDIAPQIDAFSPQKGWYFISEFNSLPHFTTAKSPDIETRVCMPNGLCEELPRDTQPPLFLVWGLDPIELKINEKNVSVLSDNQQILSTSSQWLPILSHQLSYLSQVFPNASTQSWKIAFFSIDKKAGNIGGAAGSNMILVNVLTEENELSKNALQWLLKIAAHESTHILGTQEMPGWAAESLAEYYAYHSLNQTQLKTKKPIEQWQKFKKVFPYADTGLLEASMLVSEKNQYQYQYYPLFYVKGSAFWQSLNEALEGKGSSLDMLVNNLAFNEDGQLNASFTQKVIAAIGTEKWSELSDMFL